MDTTPKGASRVFGHMQEANYGGSLAASPLSGSELALRVALCDLVERLKHSEQTCKYLEQCRNELAKEVIKLRQENMVIARENSLSSAIIQSELLSRSKYDADFTPKYKQPSLGRPEASDLTDSKQRHALNELELLKSSTQSEESWEEITVRLLRQLNEEMKRPLASVGTDSSPDSAAKSTAASSSSSPTDIPKPPEAVQRPRVFLTQTTTVNADGDASSKSARDDVYETQTKQLAINEPGERTIDMPSEQFLSFSVQEGRNQLKSVISSGNEAAERREAPNDRSGDIASSAVHYANNENSNGGSGAEQKAHIDLCAKVLHALSSDLDAMGRRLCNQNEKLTKLKNKQLRSYFRRHLNEDHIVIQTSSGKTHLEHV